MRILPTTSAIIALSLSLTACGDLLSFGSGSSDPLEGTPASPPGTAMAMGNDASEWANDGECDDPRFQGEGMATALNTDYIGQDSTDCQSLLSAGRIQPNPLFDTPADAASINYGDDAGTYPNDGECDDIRFTGDYAEDLPFVVNNIGHDASDCRSEVEAGNARWQGNTATPEYGLTLAEMRESQ